MIKKLYIIIIFLFVFLTGCASIEKQKTEIRTNQFQNILGFVITGAGLVAGAYIGSQSADKSIQEQTFSYGLIGGILGGLLSGGIYYLAMQIIAERVVVEEYKIDLKTEDTILLPESR